MTDYVERRRDARREHDRSLEAENLNLKRALEHRHRIGLAQGIIMHRYGLDEGAAFRFLARLSQAANVKLYEIAARVAQDGVDNVEHPAYPAIDGTSDHPTS